MLRSHWSRRSPPNPLRPARISYRQLITYFYRMHDPTTSNRQGPDTGTQYRSGIFYHDEEQAKEAREITKQVNEKWWKGAVVTEILKAGEWWDAEAYHQKYLENNPGGADQRRSPFPLHNEDRSLERTIGLETTLFRKGGASCDRGEIDCHLALVKFRNINQTMLEY
ncbi:hypothetical protein EYC84_004749 [Monilinia fructicola]|uniref:peptide-methionine (S)-S-oxide reductase n=1 Tax=Monilinia fructicola TaxID=38448 RepID=A0A5M9K4M0_MONFR|nr:hypothetical protein EYC84_004749 [Monilinia fructicola]